MDQTEKALPKGVMDRVSNESYMIVDSASTFLMYIGITFELVYFQVYLDNDFLTGFIQWLPFLITMGIKLSSLKKKWFKTTALVKIQLMFVRMVFNLLYVDLQKSKFKNEIEVEMFLLSNTGFSLVVWFM